MAAQLGRTLIIQLDTTGSGSYSTVGSLRTKTFKISDESVDVTTADSTNQWREILANAGIKSMEVSGSGLFADGTAENLINTLIIAGTIRNWKITHPALGTYTGAFHIDSFDGSGEYNGAFEFSLALSSAGEITFAAA